MTLPLPSEPGPDERQALGTFLSHRFGDGLVYLTSERDRVWYRRAVERGLLSEEGYLTGAGRAFLLALG